MISVKSSLLSLLKINVSPKNPHPSGLVEIEILNSVQTAICIIMIFAFRTDSRLSG